MYIVGFTEELADDVRGRVVSWVEEESLRCALYKGNNKEKMAEHFCENHYEMNKADRGFIEICLYDAFIEEFSELCIEDCFDSIKEVKEEYSCADGFIAVADRLCTNFHSITERSFYSMDWRAKYYYSNIQYNVFPFESFLELFSNDDDMKKLYVHLYKYDIFAIEVPDKAIEVE